MDPFLRPCSAATAHLLHSLHGTPLKPYRSQRPQPQNLKHKARGNQRPKFRCPKSGPSQRPPSEIAWKVSKIGTTYLTLAVNLCHCIIFRVYAKILKRTNRVALRKRFEKREKKYTRQDRDALCKESTRAGATTPKK